jgi:hypothetical protein
MGGFKLSNFILKPMQRVSNDRGGLLIPWNEDFIDIIDTSIGDYQISMTLVVCECGAIFRLPNVYDPLRHNQKAAFL